MGVGATVEIRVIGAERLFADFSQNACGFPNCILRSFLRDLPHVLIVTVGFFKIRNHYECHKSVIKSLFKIPNLDLVESNMIYLDIFLTEIYVIISVSLINLIRLL